jgi:hypothetical protein
MGADTQRPIAVVIVGGTVSAAVLILIVLPVTYLLYHRMAQRFGWGAPVDKGDPMANEQPLGVVPNQMTQNSYACSPGNESS